MLDTVSGILVDLDGTLVRERQSLPGAIELLQRFQDRFVIVSNNSTHTAAGLANGLSRAGLPVDPSRLVLAGETAVEHLAENRPGDRIMMIASSELRGYARSCGLHLVDRDPDSILLARDPRFSYAKLTRAANATRDGAVLITTNGDRSHPSRSGGVVPETGSLLAAVLSAAGADARCDTVIGKPGPILLERGLVRLGLPAADVAMIGDNPETDGIGARALGLPCILLGEAPQASAPDLPTLLNKRASGTNANERRNLNTASMTGHRTCDGGFRP